MSRYLYYGFSGKYFRGSDIEKAVELLKSERKKIDSAILYQNGDGFSEFVYGCCCFIISNEVRATKLRQINQKYFNHYKGSLKRMFSEYDDEWRVKGKIPLSFIKGIGLPMNQLKIYDWNGDTYHQSQLRELFSLAESLKLDIVDSDEFNFSSQYEEIKSTTDRRIYDPSLKRLIDGSFSSQYFYHGLSRKRSSLDKLLRILKEGIKCKRLLGHKTNFGYNGLDYVSLCKKYPKKEYDDKMNAFFEYVYNSFCVIVSEEVPAFKLALDDIQPNILDEDLRMQVSDMFDEWQVHEYIPPSSIIGIGIPLKTLKKFMKQFQKEDFELLRQILFLAMELGLDIVDSSDSEFVEKYERTKKKESGKVYQVQIDLYTGMK